MSFNFWLLLLTPKVIIPLRNNNKKVWIVLLRNKDIYSNYQQQNNDIYDICIAL